METRQALRVIATQGFEVRRTDVLRHVRVAPYLEGRGPVFDLVLWDAHSRASTGQHQVGYALFSDATEAPIFCAADIGVPPSQSIDSDDAVHSVLGWLTLRPGDTDDEFFAGDTEAQKAYRAADAEVLSWAAEDPADSEHDDAGEWEPWTDVLDLD